MVCIGVGRSAGARVPCTTCTPGKGDPVGQHTQTNSNYRILDTVNKQNEPNHKGNARSNLKQTNSKDRKHYSQHSITPNQNSNKGKKPSTQKTRQTEDPKTTLQQTMKNLSLY